MAEEEMNSNPIKTIQPINWNTDCLCFRVNLVLKDKEPNFYLIISFRFLFPISKSWSSYFNNILFIITDMSLLK